MRLPKLEKGRAGDVCNPLLGSVRCEDVAASVSCLWWFESLANAFRIAHYEASFKRPGSYLGSSKFNHNSTLREKSEFLHGLPLFA